MQVSRREILSIGAALPLAVPAPASPALSTRTWDEAVSAYTSARQRHEAFLDNVLDPACRAAKATGHGMTPTISQLEDQGNDLGALRHAALRELVGVPAQTTHQLRLKFRLAYEEVLQFEDSEGLIRAILADLEWLPG